ncbi:hypothetical protein [Streptomyces kaniharaensis]|uniref:hypothetical protein n=1 Tax=Streptomyces kaniharaensis TaxID=212423 RepID=UPI0012964A60|nr:hypothetical protein [Streptomyces kaniharaensis]
MRSAIRDGEFEVSLGEIAGEVDGEAGFAQASGDRRAKLWVVLKDQYAHDRGADLVGKIAKDWVTVMGVDYAALMGLGIPEVDRWMPVRAREAVEARRAAPVTGARCGAGTASRRTASLDRY